MKITKVQITYFGGIITTKDWKNFATLQFEKKIRVFLENSYQITTVKKPQMKNK